MDLAEQIDNIQGNDIWRTEKKCALYEMDRIQARIDELVSVYLSVVYVCHRITLHIQLSDIYLHFLGSLDASSGYIRSNVYITWRNW